MNCEVCVRSATNAFFHQSLHQENRSNKVVQVALGVIILTAITFSILGMTPCLPLRAMAWGINATVVSFVALGVFRCSSSTEFERHWKQMARKRDDFKNRVMDEDSDQIGKYGFQIAKLKSEISTLKLQLSEKS